MALGSVFIVAANFTVPKDAEMVLVSEVDGAPEAYDLIGVFPSDEMIPEAPGDEEGDEFLHRVFRVQDADKEVLSARMVDFRNNAPDKESPDADAE